MEKKMYRLLVQFYKADGLTNQQINELAQADKPGEVGYRTARLEKMKFIQAYYAEPDRDGYAKILGYQITLDGMAYVEEHRRTLLMFWIPYAITTGIAIAALVLAA